MCSESDLKDLGLPMGPRKKLQGLLKEEQNKKVMKWYVGASVIFDILQYYSNIVFIMYLEN